MSKKTRIREKHWDEKDPKNDLAYVEVSLPDQDVDSFLHHYAATTYLREQQRDIVAEARTARKRKKLLTKILRAAALSLTDRQMQIFTLRHVTGLKETDIAKQVGVNQSYISSVLHTSYKKIKKTLHIEI